MVAVARCIGGRGLDGWLVGHVEAQRFAGGIAAVVGGGRPETAMLDTGWRPQYTFDEALQDYLKWLSEYPTEPCARGCEPA